MAKIGIVGVAGLLLLGCAGEAPPEEPAEAQGASVSAERETFVRRARPRIEGCFTHDWRAEGFRYAENPKYRPEEGWLEWSWSTVSSALARVGDALGQIVLAGSEGDRLIVETIARLKALAERHRLLPFQKTMAAQCVVANLWEYSASTVARVLGGTAAVEYEQGVCIAYAQVAARLLNGIGVWARPYVVMRENHAFVEVHYPDVDGTSYFIEPQLDPATNPAATFLNKH